MSIGQYIGTALTRARKVRATITAVRQYGLVHTIWLLYYHGTLLGGGVSAQKRLPVGNNGSPLPWITYPAIEFLMEYDYSNCLVFEYGSGNSSKFWAERCLRITSVEHDPGWYEFSAKTLASNQSLLLRQEPHEYVHAVDEEGCLYDVIVIDGRYRYDCATAALRRLTDRGFIILDNSDWHPLTTDLLRSAGLLQVDFKGTCPINPYASCTSVFFRRSFCIPRKSSGATPLSVIGGLVHRADHDRPCISQANDEK